MALSDQVPPTILLAEDDSGTRLVLAMVLKRQGYKVIEAPTGTAALATLAGAEKIDALVSDCGLPGASVSEIVAAALRCDPPVRVLLTSGYPPEALRRRGDFPEGHPFLTKPFTPKVLVQRLEELLAQPAATPSNP